MMVLQATQDIRKVSLWLGHSNLATTEIYVRADPSRKARGHRGNRAAASAQGQVPAARQTDRTAEDQVLMESRMDASPRI